MNAIETWTKSLSKVTALMNAIATLWIFGIMFLMAGDVLGRVLLNHPITGTPELVKISIVGIVFMQMPHTLLKGRHIRSEIIVQRLNVSKSIWLELIASLAGALVFIALFVASWSATVTSWELLEYEGEGALRVPVYPIRSIILLGSALTAIIFAAQVVKALKEMWNIYRRTS